MSTTTSGRGKLDRTGGRDRVPAVEDRLHNLSERLQTLARHIDERDVSRADEVSEGENPSGMQGQQTQRINLLSERLQTLVKQIDERDEAPIETPLSDGAQTGDEVDKTPVVDREPESEVPPGDDNSLADEPSDGDAKADAEDEAVPKSEADRSADRNEEGEEGERGEEGEGASAEETSQSDTGEGQQDPRTLKIHRERSSQRIHQRTAAPLHVTINGNEYTAVDWSLGGLRVTDYDQPAERGDRISLTLSIPFQGFHVAFDTEADVMRANIDSGDLGLKFVDLTDRARELMAHFLDELIRGSMGTAGDTIRRIDLPVTPTDIERLRDEARKVPVRRQRLRSIVIGTLYVVLGVGVVTYLVFAIYANMLRLEVTSAVLAAPMQTLSAPADGVLVSMGKVENDAALLGDQLFVIGDPALQERVARAAVAVDEKRSQLTLLEGHSGRSEASGAADNPERVADLAAARRDVGFALRQLTAVENHRAGMAVKAPTDGRVRRVFKASGSMVVKGEPLVLFERTSEPRQIHAFLTQDEVLKIAKGDEARIYFPSTDHIFDATVIRIDRSRGAIEPDFARYDWDDNRNAMVVLDQPDLNMPALREELNAGTPAVVVFRRSFANALIADFFEEGYFAFDGQSSEVDEGEADQ
jgi:multidrug resistance efflux pump